MRSIRNVYREPGLNRYAGMWSWVLQRITGIALTLYLFPHIIVLSSARQGEAAFNQTTVGIQTPIWHIFDILLLGAFLLHAFNGLRIIAVDTEDRGYAHKKWLLAMVILGGAAMIAGSVGFIMQMFRE